MTTGLAAERRAARLLRWYPRSWRARYGEEFTELLLAEFAEVPRSRRRAADVIISAMVARLTSIGLTGHQADPAGQVRASLATLGCALAAFLTFGMAMLAQLDIGWQWASPRTGATTSAMVIMSGAALSFLIIVAAALAPLASCAVAEMLRRKHARRLACPAALVLAAGTALVIGAHHFQNAWPGTGGTAAHRGIVPAGPAAFSWASTLSVSSYWLHPAALRAFPAGEVAWMALSPLALVGLAGGTAVLVRRLRLPARLLGYEARLAAAAALAMASFLGGAACWVFGQGSGPAGLFHAGAVDVAGLAVMAVAAAAGVRAAIGARRAALALPALAGGSGT